MSYVLENNCLHFHQMGYEIFREQDRTYRSYIRTCRAFLTYFGQMIHYHIGHAHACNKTGNRLITRDQKREFNIIAKKIKFDV